MIIIDARRWRDRVYGNTYHSVVVNVDGKVIGRCPFAYGYGEQYLMSAFEILADNGIFPYERTDELVTVKAGTPMEYQTPKEAQNKMEAYHQFTMDMRENREKYYVTCADVERKKDL